MSANHGPAALGASGQGHLAAVCLSGATAWCPHFHTQEDEMTAHNGTEAPTPPKEAKQNEPTGKRVVAWVRLGPAWWPTASNLDPTPSEVA